jgi:hypothetical protein
MYRFSFLLLTAALLSQCARPLSLQFNPPDNAVTVYTMDLDSDTQSQVMGMDMTTETDQEMVYSLSYRPPAANGDRTVEVVYNSISMKQVTPQGTMNYDSQDPSANDGNPTATMMDALINEPFTMVITPTGETREIKGLAELLDNAIDQLEGLNDEIKESLKSQFGGAAVTDNLRYMHDFYPPAPVKAGASWTAERVINSGAMELEVSTLYTFVGREENGLVRIQVEGDILTNPDAEPMDIMGMSFTYDLAGTQMGFLLVEETTGLVERSEITQAFTGEMKADSEMTGPMTISMIVDNTVKIRKGSAQP